MADHTHQAYVYLEGLVERFSSQGNEVQTVIEEGSPVHIIHDVADRENVDLVAMASHGLTGLSRVFYGSVAVGVVHRVDRPLLIVRSDGDI